MGLVPVTAADGSERSQRARRRRAVLAQRTLSYLSPEFRAIHPVGHDLAEEDVMLLDLNFMSQSAEATRCVPSYSRWLEAQDHTATYEYFRRVLKVLSWKNPGSAWMLKTLHHLEYLDVFLKVFPDATVVQTHRDPRVAVPSFCSMVRTGGASSATGSIGSKSAVHALCPGGVASNIARDAPRLLKPILDPALRRVLRSPDEAIGPVVYLCCAPEAGDSTGLYLHLMNRKQVSQTALDPSNGAKLWEVSQAMVER